MKSPRPRRPPSPKTFRGNSQTEDKKEKAPRIFKGDPGGVVPSVQLPPSRTCPPSKAFGEEGLRAEGRRQLGRSAVLGMSC